MSHALARLLGNDHPLFAFNLHQLEIAAAGSGVDVKLIGDITQSAHAVMRSLDLDPADTTAEELYHVLNTAVTSGNATKLLANTQYVLIELGGERISFSLYDVIENAHHEIPFAQRKLDHAVRYLRAEIIERYADHDRTDNTLVHKLAEEAGMTLHDRDEYEHIDAPLQDMANEGSSLSSDTKPSILMVGDIFTDAFIQLPEDSARIIEQDGTKWLALPYGQKPAYDRVDIVRSVGPSPNVAVSAARLGLKSSLMAWVGGDDTGKEALQHLQDEHISTENMVVEEDKKTSYWYALRYKSDRTMLVKSEKYKYEWIDPSHAPSWIYLSYIGADSWPLHEAMLEYLEAHPETKLAFQPGTFHFKWGVDKLRSIYGRSEVIVLNREEAVDITGGNYDDLDGLMNKLHELGPKIVVVTDGPNGSYASYDYKKVTIPNYPDPGPPVDRTGAGDAFASTIVSALALGKSMDEALTWAPINSMSVVQQLGAQAGLLHEVEIKDWLEKAPETYKLREL